jgi:two-component system sensor histidine kinase AlgZ
MPAHHPLDALFRPAALVAVVVVGEALALMLALAPAHPAGGRLVQFGLISLGLQWTSLGTLCAIYLLRRVLARLQPSLIAWACLGLLLTMTLLVSFAATAALNIGATDGDTPRFIVRMLSMALIVGLFSLLAYQNYWRARQFAVRAKQSELESLQARIQPHFLFNTLNTGAALIHARPDEAERLLLDLADLFRAALIGPRLVPLEQELELTRRYLEIESLRFGPRLTVRWHLPAQLPRALVPSLSVQPLAENAIRHGIEQLPDGGVVDIRVIAGPGHVAVAVENDMPSTAPRGGGHAVGLASARARVDALTEGRGRVESHVKHGRYVATITLPIRDAEQTERLT